MKRFDAVGFGALNVDKLYKVNRIAHEDEESFVKEIFEACGGSAANTIVGLARLGLKTGYIGKVARDREGNLLLEEFKREGVDTSGIIVAEKGHSGTVLGFVDEKGERALYVAPGVNDEIEFEEINTSYAESARILHLTSFVGEKPFRAQKRLLEAISKDVLVSFDPGTLYARKGLEKLKPILERAYIVLPSKDEIELIAGKSFKEAAKLLLGLGISIVAVKLGEKGCYVTDGKEEYFIEAFRVKVVDTTGAGDAFDAGFLYGLLKGKDLYDCGRLGNFVASRCIASMGARTGLPRLSELKEAGF